MTDLVRTTLLFENQVDQEQLLSLVDLIFKTMSKTPLIYRETECRWYCNRKQDDIDPKFRSNGYSDLSLVFSIDLPVTDDLVKTLCFELQINTKDFIRTKKLETPIYQAKKIELAAINKILKMVTQVLNLDYKPFGVKDLDNLTTFLIKNNKIDKDGYALDVNYMKYIASMLIRKSFTTPAKTSKTNLLFKDITSISTNYRLYEDLYLKLISHISKFATLNHRSNQLYKGLKGVINDPGAAILLYSEIIKLPAVADMLNFSQKKQ